MKKFFSIILLLLILTTGLSSCKNIDSPVYVNNRFMYLMEKTGYGEMTLFKYDIVAKNVSVACPDPLCKHDSNCIATGIESFTVIDGYIYLCRGTTMKNIDVYIYDLSKNEVDYLISGTQVSTIYETDDYSFFTLGKWVYDENDELIGQIFEQYRYNPRTKELKKVNDKPLTNFLNLTCYDDEKIIWYAPGEGYFSTDYDFKNKKETERPLAGSEKYSFDIKVKKEYGSWRTMYRTDKETGEQEILFEDASSFRWTNTDEKKSLLYIPSEYVLKEIRGEMVYALQDQNKIGYIDAYNITNRKVWDIPENVYISSIFADSRCQNSVDSYVGIESSIVTYDDDGNTLYLENGLFIINYKTGESFYITNEYTRSYLQ